MANPPKQKGTKAETELRILLKECGIVATRTPSGHYYDLDIVGDYFDDYIEALATRPDHGRWLVTVDLATFADFVNNYRPNGNNPSYRIEVKRYARFSLHTIWDKKFGKGKV